jgi:DNA-binding NarL/FixJ family response regulator
VGKDYVVRIFVVDDNAMIRACLRTALEKRREWVVVGEAEDGRRALEKWGEVLPELIVMDFVMPEMNGLEASRQLAKSHPEAPILMVTVDPSQQLAQEARKAGVKGLVPKSDLQSLLNAVDALLKGQTYFSPARMPA